MAMTGEVLKNFTWHATYRQGPGASLFMARLAQVLIDSLTERSAFGRRILEWGDTAGSDALCLRACAALHALARTGEVVELSAVYPPAETTDDELRIAVAAAIEDADAFLVAYLDRPPQTNEPNRSGIVLGGCLLAAERFALPLRVYEIGASAGLNLRLGDYGCDLGNGRRWGRADAPLTVRTEWRGNLPPLDAPLRIVRADGCDLTPLDPGSDEDAARLVSYVWADQYERLERMEAALRHARRDTIRVKQANAADWLEQRLASPPTAGLTRFIFHTMVLQYLTDVDRGRVIAAIEQAGAEATEDTPLAWFRFENDSIDHGSARVDMRMWPGGEDRTLGRADYHGRWVEWM